MGLSWSGSGALDPPATCCEESDATQTDPVDGDAQRKKVIQTELIKFKEELDKKREARRDALSAIGKRMADLREEKEKEKEQNERLNGDLEKIIIINNETNERVKQLEEELKQVKFEKDTLSLEVENLKRIETEEKLESVKSEEVEGLERQVKALKDVAGISAEMLRIRELQVNELKAKLTAIEETGQAYEKEVDNMRRLRALYEERARAVSLSHKMELDREKARLVASEAKLELSEQKVASLEEKKSELNASVNALDKTLDETKGEISELKLELAGKCEELYNVTSQMAIINQLFSQVLSGPDGLERVTRVLEEHHDLVNHLTAKGKINDLASTLLELADQRHTPTEEEQDIAANLSKVWRLLVELLGHHVKPAVPGCGSSADLSIDSCYKSIDTPKGPKLVISVSQTFLRLKDLILEKNSLVKEVGRLKELNSTLESRLSEQESRLAVVAAELHSTWDVVNRLKVQHKHLHTHEKVLRYELAQKRLMLNELKKELENCRESWELARAKNSQTEEDWRVLRKEFASRKQVSSAESGYEESPGDSQDEEEWSTREEAETEGDSSREEIDSEEIKEDAPSSPINQEENEVSEIKEETDEKEVTDVLPKPVRTAEEILKTREDRLKRLEEQCQGLFNKMNQTSQRSDKLSHRLGELHEHYGEEGRQRKQRNDSHSEDTASILPEPTLPSAESSGSCSTSSHSEDATTILPEPTLPSPAESSVTTVLTTKPTPDLDPDPKT